MAKNAHDGRQRTAERWDAHLPRVECSNFLPINSVSAATGLAPNEVTQEPPLPPPPSPSSSTPTLEVTKRLDRDGLEYCDPTADRQRRSNELVQEKHSLTVSCVERRNSTQSDAFKHVPTYTVGVWVWACNHLPGCQSLVPRCSWRSYSLNWTGPFKVFAVAPLPSD